MTLGKNFAYLGSFSKVFVSVKSIDDEMKPRVCDKIEDKHSYMCMMSRLVKMLQAPLHIYHFDYVIQHVI